MKSAVFVVIAVLAFSPVIAASPDIAQLIWNAQNASAQGRTPEAVSYYNSAIALKPRDADLYFGRAEAYRLSGDFAKAQGDYESTCR